MVPVEVADAEIRALARAGYLPDDIAPGPADIGAAVALLMNDVLPGRRDGVVRFRVKMPPAFVGRLVALGWLTWPEAKDPEAVRAAFCVFAEEAVAREVRRVGTLAAPNGRYPR